MSYLQKIVILCMAAGLILVSGSFLLNRYIYNERQSDGEVTKDLKEIEKTIGTGNEGVPNGNQPSISIINPTSEKNGSDDSMSSAEGEGKTENFAVLTFVGDIMLSRLVGEKISESSDWRWPFLEIGDYLKGSDFLFGNLEGPISGKGRNVGSKYSFRADPRVIEGLTYAGFDVLSVANNHMGDWGRVAAEDTFTLLKENSIDYVGGGFNENEARRPVMREVNGIKLAFLAYTALGPRYIEAKEEKSGIVFLPGIDKLRQEVEEACKKADVVVVSFHFGEEYTFESNTFQKDVSRAAIDACASLVVGHHPHVVQEIEEYGGGYIAYSLGNFIFDQTFSQKTMEGLLIRITVKDKEIIDLEPVKIQISPEFQVELVE